MRIDKAEEISYGDRNLEEMRQRKWEGREKREIGRKEDEIRQRKLGKKGEK